MSKNPTFVKGTLGGIDVEIGNPVGENPPLASALKSETGWLIESENGFYVYVNATTYGYASLGWTGQHDKALRFARQQDAEEAIKLLRRFGLCLPAGAKGATEHAWYL